MPWSVSVSVEDSFFASDATPARVRALYAHYSELTREAVLARLPTGEPKRHLYDLLPPYVLRPGKALRPVLCLATCHAFGGSVEDALPAAVALELLHNAFLVHDDIQDESPMRRGQPSLHVEHGVPLALNAGDALAALAMSEMIGSVERYGSRLGADVLAEFDSLVRETIEGQAIELGWQRDAVTDLTVDDYLGMVFKKTSWYTAVQPVRIGALIGSRGTVDPGYGIPFGGYLGAMFQLANDLAGLLGDRRNGNSAPGADVLEGKRSLMMIHLLEHLGDTDRVRLVSFLARPRPERSREEVAWVLDCMHQAGSVDYGRTWLKATAEIAECEAEATFAALPESDDRQLLLWMVPELARINRAYFPSPPLATLGGSRHGQDVPALGPATGAAGHTAPAARADRLGSTPSL